MPEVVKGLPSSTNEMQLNVRYVLEHAARAHGDQAVVTDMAPDGTHRYTYAEMYERVHQAANLLTDLGVGPGSAVGIYDYSTHRYVELIYALGGIGATPFLINHELPDDHKRHCIEHVDEHADLEYLFADGELLDELVAVLDDPGEFEYALMRDVDGEGDSVTTLGTYEDLIADRSTEYDWPEVDEDTAALLGFTGGTTGKPKALAHSHRALWLLQTGWVGATQLDPLETVLMVPPMFHWGWQLWGTSLLGGSKLVLPGTGYPDNLTDLLFEEDVTYTAGVPTLFRRVLDRAEAREAAGKDVDLEGLRVFFSGQAPPVDLLRDLEEYGVESRQAYNYSEIGGGPLLAVNVQGAKRQREADMSTDEFFEYVSDVAGYLVPGSKAKLLDVDDGTELPWDGESPGDLAVRTPWASNEYWNMPERTEGSVVDDYMTSGDFVTLDEHANLRLLDRVKSVIKSGGEWIPTPTLEEYINESPLVAESCVIAADHPEWMERPVAVVELVDDAEEADFDIDDLLSTYVESGAIEKWWIPDEVVFVDEIPLTGTGKFDKSTLRDRYADILID